jgi:hypothetical protein
MDQRTLIFITLMVAVGVISWYRIGKKTVMDLITRRDKLTTKASIQMALQMLGSAISPNSAKSQADAIAVVERALEDHGMSYAVVVNVLVMGFLGGYIAKNQLSSDRAQALLLHGSTSIADSYKLNGAVLWDRSGELTKVLGPIGFLLQKAVEGGTSLPHEVQDGSVLTSLLLDAVRQAGG